MKLRGIAVVAGLVALLLSLTANHAIARGGYLTTFNTLYNGTNGHPASASGTNASCAICHDATAGPDVGLNAYGNAFRASTGTTTTAKLLAIETANSVNINGGTTNLDEITASTQPGWTTGSNNPLFTLSGAAAGSTTAPSGIGTLDPVASPGNQAPILNPPGDKTVNVAETLTVNLSATDADGDALTFSFGSTPPATGMTLTPGTNYGTANLSWTPPTSGNFAVTGSATRRPSRSRWGQRSTTRRCWAVSITIACGPGRPSISR